MKYTLSHGLTLTVLLFSLAFRDWTKWLWAEMVIGRNGYTESLINIDQAVFTRVCSIGIGRNILAEMAIQRSGYWTFSYYRFRLDEVAIGPTWRIGRSGAWTKWLA